MRSPTPPPGALLSFPQSPPPSPHPPPTSNSYRARVGRWYVSNLPALTLVGLAILIPELLTGSTPVASLINPVGDAFLVGLYGGGVLVIREVSLRWNRGWGPVLLLGAAYGIVEEGLGTKTFFDWVEIKQPNFGPLTHWGGVNWVWAGELTLFHAIFSIALPIAIVALLFPQARRQRFLSNAGVAWTFALYSLTATLMFFLFDRGYVLAPALLAGCVLAIAALMLAAWKLPEGWFRARTSLPTVAPRTELFLGAGFVWGFFILFLGLPGFLKNPLLTVALGWAFTGGCLLALRATIGETGNDSHVAYLAIGLLTFLVAFAALAELLGDLFAFLAIAVAVLLMVRLYRRYRPVNAPWPRDSGPDRARAV
ncbi:MAG: hypothetical protein L3K14_01975 [Thermoplasmata archaeon]|nr:hypothetical protein [Thermoplasmata archaeon]